jgi:hypothetical protein
LNTLILIGLKNADRPGVMLNEATLIVGSIFKFITDERTKQRYSSYLDAKLFIHGNKQICRKADTKLSPNRRKEHNR